MAESSVDDEHPAANVRRNSALKPFEPHRRAHFAMVVARLFFSNYYETWHRARGLSRLNRRAR